MMMESIGFEQHASSNRRDGRRSAFLLLAAAALLIAAVALAWAATRRIEDAAGQLGLAGELQLESREAGAIISRAAAGDQAASKQLRERAGSLRAGLAVLAVGGFHNGRDVAAATGDLPRRLDDLADRWADLVRQAEALAAANDPKLAKDPARRAADRRSAAAQKSAAAREAEAAAAAAALVGSSSALAAELDGIRGELEAGSAQRWLAYAALACALAALAMLGAVYVSIRRSAQAARRTADEAKAAVLDGLRPAMRTLRIDANADALADPAALGRRLSDEVLAVIDGITALVRALDASTAEADKFAVVGHVAARALAEAEQRAAQSASNLQSTARRIVAVYAALTTRSAEVQQQCAQVLEVVASGSMRSKESARAAEQLQRELDGLAATYAKAVAMNSEIAQGLREVADLLTRAEGYALRGAERLGAARADDAVAFANEVRGYLGPSLATLKQAMALVQRAGREGDDFSGALARTAAIAGDQPRTAHDAAHALDGVERALQELAARVSSMARFASEPEASQLHSALEDIVRQLAQSSTSARGVIDATRNAASRIEELAKLLNTMKPS